MSTKNARLRRDVDMCVNNCVREAAKPFAVEFAERMRRTSINKIQYVVRSDANRIGHPNLAVVCVVYFNDPDVCDIHMFAYYGGGFEFADPYVVPLLAKLRSFGIMPSSPESADISGRFVGPRAAAEALVWFMFAVADRFSVSTSDKNLQSKYIRSGDVDDDPREADSYRVFRLTKNLLGISVVV